jgi:hypothetical protein
VRSQDAAAFLRTLPTEVKAVTGPRELIHLVREFFIGVPGTSVDGWCPVAESATSATTDEIGAVVRSNRTTTDLDPLGGEHHRVHRSGAGQTPTNEKGTAIMKLTTTTMVTVDGVMQGLGGPDEDRSGGFERGGWVAPLFDNEAGTLLNQVYQRADAFLFGRRTYEIFAGSWGTMADPAATPSGRR